ncbi:MAG: carboxypeptidase-like regulatory domain-containing protein [Saprospiraceae bacterium]
MKIYYSLLLLLLTSFTLSAQKGIVRGNVYDKETGDPIIYGTVQLSGTTMGGNTDINGFFTIADVPAGNYTLQASYIGYDSTAVDIKVANNAIVYKSLYITEAATTLGTVNVSASREQARSDVQVSKVTVTPKQIRSLPSTGGEADIAQYLPVLPGIIVTGDQGGQLYIRGGSPIQNKILLDGMTIYNPFHSIGFFSVFETEAIKSVDVLTGGFNAEYGGRISAIVDIKTREGNRKKYGGVVSSSPFLSKVLLEGPLKKLKESGGGSSSFLLTAKHSYLDETSKVLYQYEPIDTLGLPYGFTDLYGKLSFQSENGSKFNLFGFNFNDRVNFVDVANLGWTTTGAGTNFTLVPPASNVVLNGTIAFSRYDIELDEGDGNPRTSGITDYSANLNFTYFGNKNQVDYGFRFTGINTDFRFRNFLGVTINQEDFTTELAGYLKYKQTIGKLILQPSIRLQFYASQSDVSIEPRLGAKYNATDFLRFKLAAGIYSQNLVSSVNERDVVNLFVGFLSGPEETIFNPGTRTPTDDRLQKSAHAILGAEIDLSSQITANVEGYYKDFRQLINLNRNKLGEQDPNFATENGEAYGVDFSLKYENRDLYLWATYSLGYVNRFDGEQTYPTIFDRRHNINLLGTYTFGEDKTWEASLRWNFGTGFPFTQTQSFHTLYNYLNGIDTNVLTGNPDEPSEGGLGILYSETRNGGRLPTYHRMDASVKKRIEFTKSLNLELTASITNIYNRQNIFFFDRVDYDRVDQLPILPSLAAKLSF